MILTVVLGTWPHPTLSFLVHGTKGSDASED